MKWLFCHIFAKSVFHSDPGKKLRYFIICEMHIARWGNFLQERVWPKLDYFQFLESMQYFAYSGYLTYILYCSKIRPV